jgi:hypothetical protein
VPVVHDWRPRSHTVLSGDAAHLVSLAISQVGWRSIARFHLRSPRVSSATNLVSRPKNTFRANHGHHGHHGHPRPFFPENIAENRSPPRSSQWSPSVTAHRVDPTVPPRQRQRSGTETHRFSLHKCEDKRTFATSRSSVFATTCFAIRLRSFPPFPIGVVRFVFDVAHVLCLITSHALVQPLLPHNRNDLQTR